MLRTSLIVLSLLGVSLSAFADPSPRPASAPEPANMDAAVQIPDMRSLISSELDDANDELADMIKRQSDLEKYDRYGDDAKTKARYGASCDCSPKTECGIKSLIIVGAITDDQVVWKHFKSSSGTEVQFQDLLSTVDRAQVCVKVYENSENPTFNRACRAAAIRCGAVKYARDKKRLPEEIKTERDLRDALKQLLAELPSERKAGENKDSQTKDVAGDVARNKRIDSLKVEIDYLKHKVESAQAK
jgi:hypothetical protein